MKKFILLSIIFFIFVDVTSVSSQESIDSKKSASIIQRFKRLTKSTKWRLVDQIDLKFRTYHPQGMVKIGDNFYLSAVQTISRPTKFENPQNCYDRTPGEGIGHLFQFDGSGNLISQIKLGEGIIYHPGGIDYDGKYIWVPVAEYRPHSRSIIYRIELTTLTAVKVFRFNDHIGGIVHNPCSNTLHGVSWGSRRFYTWKLDDWNGAIDVDEKNEYGIPEYEMRLNGNHYIDYQDCHFIAEHYMLCSGLNKYRIPNSGVIAFGGLDLIDLDLLVAVHQIPVNAWLESGLVMSTNPFYFEMVGNHLRFYFIPEDDQSKLYVYDVINQ